MDQLEIAYKNNEMFHACTNNLFDNTVIVHKLTITVYELTKVRGVSHCPIDDSNTKNIQCHLHLNAPYTNIYFLKRHPVEKIQVQFTD